MIHNETEEERGIGELRGDFQTQRIVTQRQVFKHSNVFKGQLAVDAKIIQHDVGFTIYVKVKCTTPVT